ncbi:MULTISPECIES: biopolymer transporter ExbD [unclassified Imperialibacter]|uniref:ExbD/TolR family protein n=1 Tax=unclassified Imperialibacter TaxID=2629706 RepID=UPI00125675AF|nr:MULTISPECIES: biopolymer transporter ExbD [unclassified Imperialibacter]CAD5278284.1 Biopolymer transport protein ExbD/TolR [Imperialibacter sp. 89]CAD5292450.1 Biopolymer transport protein ExbD/TolR [Imperialibacter sp. 75]VVS99777.1 Biopolymer transporter ExbD [Imperialibacter sp. EC-SDR9]
MGKFKKSSGTSQEIPTAALPDIIFMLLFFFMVTTVMRETELLVEQHLPRATQLSKIERKSLVSYIYIGPPKNAATFGTEPKIQVNDVFITPKDVVQFVNTEKDKLSEVERDQITMSMKVDIEAKMGIVADVQQELREANARKVLYSSLQGMDNQ